MLMIGVDWPLARHAGELAEHHGLHGFDAVHLATALAVDAADSGRRLLFFLTSGAM